MLQHTFIVFAGRIGVFPKRPEFPVGKVNRSLRLPSRAAGLMPLSIGWYGSVILVDAYWRAAGIQSDGRKLFLRIRAFPVIVVPLLATHDGPYLLIFPIWSFNKDSN
jgi:hypothetical protein